MTRLELQPNSHTVPWNFLLYTDELTPGAVLKPSNMRKSWAFYFSFRQLGRRHLASQHCWLPLGVLRSSVPIRGGISAAVATMLARSFTEQNTNMLDHGISLADLYNEPRLFVCQSWKHTSRRRCQHENLVFYGCGCHFVLSAV